MTITSKYNGKCKKCGGFIQAGQEIEWNKEQGPRHIVCPAQKAFTPAPKPSQISQVGGPKNARPFAPGTVPYRGKFQRLETYHEAEKAGAIKSYKPRTTTTFNDKSMTRTL